MPRSRDSCRIGELPVSGGGTLERAGERGDGLSAAQLEIPGFIGYRTLVQAWVAHAEREHESIEQCVPPRRRATSPATTRTTEN